MTSDSEEELLTIIGLLYCQMKKKKTRPWMKRYLKERPQKSVFNYFNETLKQDDDKFFEFLRMSKSTFYELLSCIKIDITKQRTKMRESIPPEEKLVITLRYLATGCTFGDLHYMFRVGKSTAGTIVHEVCDAIWKRVYNLVFEEISTEKWREIAEGFEKKTNFPRCIGVIDGKHIRLNHPSNNGTSIAVFAICDSDYSLTYIDIGSYGYSTETGVFSKTNLYEKLIDSDLPTPPPTSVGSDGIKYPFVFLGNRAFPLNQNLLKPYGRTNLSPGKKLFNKEVRKVLPFIDITFNILANNWNIFRRPLNVNTDLAEKITKAIFTLHNFVRKRDGKRGDDLTPSPNCLIELHTDATGRGNPKARDIRKLFVNYFVKVDENVV